MAIEFKDLFAEWVNVEFKGKGPCLIPKNGAQLPICHERDFCECDMVQARNWCETYFLAENERLKADLESAVHVLEAIRSQMCWERDRDQLSMGMSDLHDSVTEILETPKTRRGGG